MTQNRAQEDNIVIYMVNPYQSRRVLPWLCAAFMKIYESYRKCLQIQTQLTGDLVLQIVPLNLIASLEAITLPPAKAYSRLAVEVYNRCGPNITEDKSQVQQYHCAPSIRLARAVPKSISFRLTPDPSTALLHSDRCFHLSYSWSFHQEWLTASWTDNQGVLQWNAVYCLGEEETERWQTFLTIAREIWNTTIDILKPGNFPWRIFVVKDSPIQREELQGKASMFSLIEVSDSQ